MKSLKTKSLLSLLFLPMLFLSAQGELKSVEGYSPNIGRIVYMLEDLKDRITEQVKDLDQSQTDFQYDAQANSIGALIMHLVSTESYYQVATLEGREWTEAELESVGIAGELNANVNSMLKGESIGHYLSLWDDVRQKTLDLLKTKDDAWFASNIEEGLNYHYIWYHVMEHSANHMGQIGTIMNRLPE
ncbi:MULTISPECIES: DinB family protein [Maribacter]|uniref:DinB family protein n=1 Tax=Maribacter flavus TaxID=1658664 RepID=A0ABU7IIA7_9FLAO|nr:MULTISPECIES: DinB family protein [Maribacter]MDC6405633.1 DinB family protein [Maribacter sp. PR66]MEE1972599.1 DinB family protein [Maribacter flavus]